MTHTNHIKQLVLAALLGGLSHVANTFKITSVSPVPFTLGTLAVIVCGLVLLPYWAALSQVVHILMNVLFGSGLALLGSGSFGYFIGFIAMAFVTSVVYRRLGKSLIALILAVTLGGFTVYVFGVPYFYFATGADSWEKVLSLTFFPFIIPDILKAVVAALIGDRVNKLLRLP